MKISRHWALRTVGWAAAYVLALHTMLFGLAATPSLHAASTGSLAVELCLTGGSSHDGAVPSHSTRDHCATCFMVGGALPPSAAPTPRPIAYAVPIGRAISPVPLPPTAFHGRPGLPRAPPALLA